MVRFIDFVEAAKHDSHPETSVSMLTEAKIVSSKNQFWPKFSIYDFLRIAGFSSQWNSKSDVGTLKIKATEEQLQALNACLEGLKNGFGWDSGFTIDFSWKEMSKDSQLIFRTQNGEVAQQFEELSNEITKKYNSSDCQVNFKKIEKPVFIQVEDPATGKKKKVPDPGGKKLFGQAILNVKGPQAKIDEIVSILNGAALEGVNLDVKKFDPNAQIDGQITGDFDIVVSMLVKLLEIQGKTGLNTHSNEVVDYLNNNFEFKQDLDDETKWLAQCAYKSIYNPNNTDDEHIESVEAYCNFLKQSNVALAIRKFHILRQAEIDTVANKKEEAKKALINKADVDVDGKPLVDKDQLKAALDAAEVEAKSTWKIGKTLLQVPSMKSLFDIVGFTKKEGEEDASKSKKAKIDLVESPDFDTGTAGGRCAARRMKLFAAAEKRGAKVLKTASYVVAVCANAKQVMPFCRYKPKVKPGTNEIDPACNLEDWEGITPENKAKRDDGSGKYETIRDGIDDGHGHSFDRLVGEHGQSANGVQFAEAAWCVGGSLGGNYYWGYEGSQSSFNNYTESGKRPLIVFMDVKRGALYLYAKFLKNGSILENILNENEKCDGASPTSANPTDAMQQQFVKTMEISYPDFKKVKNYIEKIYYPDFDPDIDEEEPEFDTGTAGGRCAARRMKLFAAAEHYGATVIKTKNWVAAVCTQGAQAHQFGRLKPIVKPGTNEIDPDCNLEDWEGITPENKKKRDDETNGDRIRDGIDDGHGKSFDRLSRVSGQTEAVKYAESAWCVCGTCHGEFKWNNHEDSYFSSYSQNGKYPITVFMSTKRGAMYMYSNKDGEQNFDNESDCIDGFNKGNPYASDQTAFLNKFKIADSSFEYLHTKIRNTYYNKTGSGNSQAKTPEQLLKEAQDDGHLTQNGWLRIDNRPDALKYQPIFGDVAGLMVNKTDASNFFQGVDLQLVSVIDFCNKVQSAAAMFYQANIGSIKIINSRSLRNAYQMFRLAILEDLQQLETPNLELAEEMFYRVVPSKGGTLSVPSFDLQKCRSIKNMFYETNIQNINIRNVQNIENAYGAYFHCPQLASYPETKFPKILNLTSLTIDGSDSAAMMFPNCLTLQSKKKRQRYNTNPNLDFDACVAETERWYAENQKSGNTDLFDERGFFRVKSSEDVSKYLDDFKKFPGIVIELEDADGLFEGKNVNVKVMDVSKVKNANRMFAGSNLYQIQDLIGTETIEYANSMFYNSGSRILPDMVFNNLKECKDLLRCCNNLKALPSITINGGAQLLNKITFYYVFGSEDNIQNMLKAVGGKARCETWLNAQVKRISVKISELLKFHEDSKFIEVDSKELARFVVKNWEAAQKNMGAEGIYIKMSDASGLFYGFNSYMDSNTKNKDLVFPVIDGSEIETAVEMFKDVEVKKFSGFVNFGKLKTARSMFSSTRVTDGGIPEFDTSKISNAAYMFYGCITAEELPKLDFSAVTNAEGMFQSSLVFKPGFDLAKIYLPNAKNCNYTFKTIHTISHGGQEGMLTCSGLFLPKAEGCSEIFKSSSINGEIGDVVLPESKDISEIFMYCHNITAVRSIQAPKAEICRYLFCGCEKLHTIGTVQLPSVKQIDYGFKDTTSLKKIMVPGFNTTGYNFNALGAFKNSGLIGTFGKSMEKWKSVSSLFALMEVAAA